MMFLCKELQILQNLAIYVQGQPHQAHNHYLPAHLLKSSIFQLFQEMVKLHFLLNDKFPN